MKKIFFCLSIFIFLGLLLFSCTPTEDNPTTPITPNVPTAPNETHSYWESDGAYYFFFINFNGGAYLGKVDYGTWTACEYLPVNNYNPITHID